MSYRVDLGGCLLGDASVANSVDHVLQTLARPPFEHVTVGYRICDEHISQHIPSQERRRASLLEHKAREASESQWKE